jgi:hypothetical protein
MFRRRRDAGVDTGAARPDDDPVAGRTCRAQEAIRLLQEWLSDESGYDERAWPLIKKGLEEDRYLIGAVSVADRIMLDAAPLGALSHPRPNPEIADGLVEKLSMGSRFLSGRYNEGQGEGNDSE